MSLHMEHSQAIAANIRAEMGRQRISGRELARRLGEPPMWVHRRISGDQDLGVDDLLRISELLDVPPAKLLDTRVA